MSGIVQVAVGLAELGGAAHLGRLLARALADYATARGLSFEVLDLGGGDPDLPGIARRAFVGDRSAFARAVALRQVRDRPRLVLFDHLGPARVQALLPSALRARYGVVVLGIEVWRPLEWQRRRALKLAERVLAISETTLAQARPFLPAGVETAVVHPALEDPGTRGAADELLLHRCGDGFVLVVGRLDRDPKGHDALFAALAHLRAKVPTARLVVAGGGSDQRRLERLAVEVGVGEGVLFTGAVSAATLAELYARCAVFCMPATTEGFGLVFVEAMKAGKPCIALAGTAPAEIVVDGETGLLLADASPEALASSLAWLLASPARARRLGAGGRLRYEREFTAAAFAGRLRPHLDAMLA